MRAFERPQLRVLRNVHEFQDVGEGGEGAFFERLEGTIIFDHDVRGGSSRIVTHLRGHARARVRFRRLVANDDPRDALVGRSNDDDEGAKEVRSAIFDDQGRFVASRLVAFLAILLREFEHSLIDTGMRDRVQHLQRRGIGEHPFPHGSSVERTVGPHELFAERIDDRVEARSPGEHDLACELIRVDDGDVRPAEARADGAFSTANSTGETEDSDRHAVLAPSVGIACSTKRWKIRATHMATQKVSRRKLLMFGGGLAVAGALGVVRSSGYVGPNGAAPVALSKAEWDTVQALARRIAATDGPDAPSADDVDVVGFVDGYIASMDAPVRKDLLQFLGYIEQVAPLSLGLFSRFTRLDPAQQDRVLAALESSSSDLFRGGFQGVKALMFMGYYRDPRTWKIIGYDGPQVGRRG